MDPAQDPSHEYISHLTAPTPSPLRCAYLRAGHLIVRMCNSRVVVAVTVAVVAVVIGRTTGATWKHNRALQTRAADGFCGDTVDSLFHGFEMCLTV